MKFATKIKKIPDKLIEEKKIKEISNLSVISESVKNLQSGELTAFPTETVYGLGADARNEKAVKKIFQVKERPQDNPLIVHIGRKKQLAQYSNFPINGDLEKILNKFWPGPLTVVLPKSNIIPERTTAGLDTVGLRMPSHPVALALIRKAGFPLAAPSANSSGLPSPTMARHVMDDLSGKIPLIIDGGSCTVGVESTVITFEQDKIIILRPGGISREKLAEVTSRKIVTEEENRLKENEAKDNIKKRNIPRAPGIKYRHYSPETNVILIKKNINKKEEVQKIILKNDDQKIALVLTKESIDYFNKSNFFKNLRDNKNSAEFRILKMGSVKKPAEIAAKIFYILRELDSSEVELIIIEGIPEKGLGAAVMNRLYKAASKIIE